jgi:hypothetical protein
MASTVGESILTRPPHRPTQPPLNTVEAITSAIKKTDNTLKVIEALKSQLFSGISETPVGTTVQYLVGRAINQYARLQPTIEPILSPVVTQRGFTLTLTPTQQENVSRTISQALTKAQRTANESLTSQRTKAVRSAMQTLPKKDAYGLNRVQTAISLVLAGHNVPLTTFRDALPTFKKIMAPETPGLSPNFFCHVMHGLCSDIQNAETLTPQETSAIQAVSKCLERNIYENGLNASDRLEARLESLKDSFWKQTPFIKSAGYTGLDRSQLGHQTILRIIHVDDTTSVIDLFDPTGNSFHVLAPRDIWLKQDDSLFEKLLEEPQTAEKYASNLREFVTHAMKSNGTSFNVGSYSQDLFTPSSGMADGFCVTQAWMKSTLLHFKKEAPSLQAKFRRHARAAFSLNAKQELDDLTERTAGNPDLFLLSKDNQPVINTLHTLVANKTFCPLRESSKLDGFMLAYLTERLK